MSVFLLIPLILFTSFLISIAKLDDMASSSVCYQKAIHESQRCSNVNTQRIVLGYVNGFGSIFNHVWVNQYLRAIMSGKRVVYAAENKTWRYGCEENLGMACYFKFPCQDSVEYNSSIPVTYQSVSYPFEPIFKALDCSLDYQKSSMTLLTAHISEHIWTFNDATQQIIDEINSYYNLAKKPYLSIHLRLTDKKRDMPPDTWAFLNDPKQVVEYSRPYLAKHNIKHIFIATDECNIIPKLRSEFGEENFIFTRCEHINISMHNKALVLFSEIEMMRQSVTFLSTWYSGMDRLIYRLRLLKHINNESINFHPEWFTMDPNNLSDFGKCRYPHTVC